MADNERHVHVGDVVRPFTSTSAGLTSATARRPPGPTVGVRQRAPTLSRTWRATPRTTARATSAPSTPNHQLGQLVASRIEAPLAWATGGASTLDLESEVSCCHRSSLLLGTSLVLNVNNLGMHARPPALLRISLCWLYLHTPAITRNTQHTTPANLQLS